MTKTARDLSPRANDTASSMSMSSLGTPSTLNSVTGRAGLRGLEKAAFSEDIGDPKDVDVWATVRLASLIKTLQRSDLSPDLLLV